MDVADTDEDAWAFWEDLVAEFPSVITKRAEILDLLETARDSIDRICDQVDVAELDKAIEMLKGQGGKA